jgi:hypothetical protein
MYLLQGLYGVKISYRGYAGELSAPSAGGLYMTRIDEIMRELPPEVQQEVVDFAHFLLEKRKQKYGRKLRQDWAGALKEYRTQYTSLELQKKALECRGD